MRARERSSESVRFSKISRMISSEKRRGEIDPRRSGDMGDFERVDVRVGVKAVVM
jgi:hypothetical protein